MLSQAPGNGGRLDNYVWTQNLSDLTVNVTMPPGIKTKMLDVQILNNRLKVRIINLSTIIMQNIYSLLLHKYIYIRTKYTYMHSHIHTYIHIYEIHTYIHI